MYPGKHVIYGLIFSIIMLPLINFNLFYASIIFLSSVLIDFDHYLIYVFRKRSPNLKKAIKYFMSFKKKIHYYLDRKKKVKGPIVVFHTIEFLLAAFILSLFSKFIMLIFIGFVFHSLLDMIDIFTEFDTLSPRGYFIFNYIFKDKETIYL